MSGVSPPSIIIAGDPRGGAGRSRRCGPALLVAKTPGHARLQRPQLDETGRGALGEEAARLAEGGERLVVHRVRRGTRDNARMALVELQTDRAADLRVDAVHIGVEVGAQRLPPQARIDEIGPLAVEPRLELVLVDRANKLL